MPHACANSSSARRVWGATAGCFSCAGAKLKAGVRGFTHRTGSRRLSAIVAGTGFFSRAIAPTGLDGSGVFNINEYNSLIVINRLTAFSFGAFGKRHSGIRTYVRIIHDNSALGERDNRAILFDGTPDRQPMLTGVCYDW